MKSIDERKEIQKVTSEKDLCVIIDSKPLLREYVAKKVGIANRNLGLIFKTFDIMDMNVFLILYNPIFRPHIEYATVVWSTQFKKDINSLENVKRPATRLVDFVKNLGYADRLKALGLPTLEYRREQADLIQVYKIINNIDCVDQDKFFTMSMNRTTRGHSKEIFKNRHRLNVRANSFNNRVINTWDSITVSVVNEPSQNALK